MPSPEPWQLLRPALLEGVGVVVAGPSGAPASGYGAAASAACAGLGARVAACRPGGEGALALEEDAIDRAAEEALAECGGRAGLLVVDAAALFTAVPLPQAPGAPAGPPAGPADALGRCMQGTWGFLRVLAGRAMVEAGGGRILLIAPSPGAGEHAEAARRALENLARTLSVEWARHAVTAVSLAPADATPAGEVGALAAYLASRAGAYFSGCVLELSGP